MEAEHQPEHLKDLHAAALGQLGGQKRMAHMNTQERSALAKHAARARWHPREAQAAKERLEELARVLTLHGGSSPRGSQAHRLTG
jgi:hypothetical protein